MTKSPTVWDGTALWRMYKSFQNEFRYDGRWAHSYGYASTTGLNSREFKSRKAAFDRRAEQLSKADAIRTFLSWYLSRGNDKSADIKDILEHDASDFWMRRARMIENFNEDLDSLDEMSLLDKPRSLAVTDDNSTSLLLEVFNQKLIRLETMIILDHLSQGDLFALMGTMDNAEKTFDLYEVRWRHYSSYWLRLKPDQSQSVMLSLSRKGIENIESVWKMRSSIR